MSKDADKEHILIATTDGKKIYQKAMEVALRKMQMAVRY